LLTKRQPPEHSTAYAVEQDQACGELMPPGLFASTTIDLPVCMEKANTRGTAGARSREPERDLDHTNPAGAQNKVVASIQND